MNKHTRVLYEKKYTMHVHVKGRKHAFDAWYTFSIYDLYCLVMLFGFVIWREKKKNPTIVCWVQVQHQDFSNSKSQNTFH